MGGSSSTVWWRWWREWRQDTHSTRFHRYVELQSVHPYSVIIIYISFSHLPSSIHLALFPVSSEVTIHFQSVSFFFKAVRFKLSLPARHLAGSLLIALIFTIISFIVMPSWGSYNASQSLIQSLCLERGTVYIHL